MSHVKEEGPGLVPGNKVHSLFRIRSSEADLVLGSNLLVDDLVALDHRKVWPAFQPFFEREVANTRMVWPHVIRIGKSIVFIEAMLKRQEFLVMTQMPFSEESGGVTTFLEHFGNEHFSLSNTGAR